MTIDEELTVLDSQLRRLKIEYEIYFSNPTKRPPTDIEWKVLSLLRKFSDGNRMSFSQRFRYNEVAQRYAIYSDLWRKKNRIREEGYRRPQDALLSVQGVRVEEHEKEHKVYGVGHTAAASASTRKEVAILIVGYCGIPRRLEWAYLRPNPLGFIGAATGRFVFPAGYTARNRSCPSPELAVSTPSSDLKARCSSRRSRLFMGGNAY